MLNKILSSLRKTIKFIFMCMLKIIILFLGEGVAYDTKWYEWIIGAALTIAIVFPLIMLLALLFYRITEVWPI